MEVQHKIEGSKGSFFIKEEGALAAEMTYSRAGDQMIIIDHTDVSEQWRGKGLGAILVKAAVDYSREKGIKIMPLCPFANSVFKKEPDLQDVLK